VDIDIAGWENGAGCGDPGNFRKREDFARDYLSLDPHAYTPYSNLAEAKTG